MYHGKSISCENLNREFPSRNQFLDPKSLTRDQKIINEGRPLHFFPNDVKEEHAKFRNNLTYHVLMAGIMPSGMKIIVAARAYPYIMVRVPDAYIGMNALRNKVPDDAYMKAENFKLAIMTLFKDRTIWSNPNWEIMRKYQSDGFQQQKGFYIKIPFFSTWQRKKAILLISIEANGGKITRTQVQNDDNTVSFVEKPEPILGYHCHTASDDLTCYYRVVCRDHRFNLCGWNTIEDYSLISGTTTKFGSKNENVMMIEVDVKNIKPYQSDKVEYKRDSSIEMAWDIECNRHVNDGNMPDPRDKRDEVFMIGITFAFYHTKKSFLRLCISSVPCDNLDTDLTIVCSNERELCLSLAIIVEKMSPEFIVGFNDGGFDWQYMIEKAYYHRLLPLYSRKMAILSNSTRVDEKLFTDLEKKKKNVLNDDEKNSITNLVIMGTHHRSEKVPDGDNNIDTPMIQSMKYKRKGTLLRHEAIKIEATENTDVHMFNVFGYLAIDVRAVFRTLYKNPEKSSLNWFLTDNKLEQKEDMPIHELFSIYARMKKGLNDGDQNAVSAETHNMGRVKSYCVTDAEACHLLMIKRNVIMDKRNVSAIAYTSMDDAIYRADGMKVRNYVISDSAQREIMYSNIGKGVKSSQKYPGAFVPKPTKGMQVSKLNIRERQIACKKQFKYPNYSKDIDYSKWNITDEEATIMENTAALLIEQIDKFKISVQLEVGVSKLDTPEILEIKNNKAEKLINQHKYQLSDKLDVDLSDDRKKLLIEFLYDDTGYPISGVDFSSLYPSLMMAYNLSKEMMLVCDATNVKEVNNMEADAKYLIDNGFTLHKISFMFGEIPVLGYSVRHTYDSTNADHEPHKCRFGIFPTILHHLFNERKKIKKSMIVAGERLEEIGSEIQNKTDDERNIVYQGEEYQRLTFDFAYFKSKQLALKVFMNTFYGEAGNQLSPLFMLPLAGGVTTAGQENIKKVITFLETKKCEIVYGDTDSAYVKCPLDIYIDINVKYFSGQMTKLDYWTELVNRTFKKIDELNKMVNNMLYMDNGTRFLKTAYEEVLFPVNLLAKKNYYGIPHENIVNFNPKDLFSRGSQADRRGTSKFLAKICKDVLRSSVMIDEIRSIRQIVEDKIHEVYHTKWDIEYFIQSDSFRPARQNIRIHTFVNRMKNERDIIIKPVERFQYVYVKRYPKYWDIKGNTHNLSKGDMMEFVDIAKSENLEIDLDHYVSSAIGGQFARYVIYHRDFTVEDCPDQEVRELDLAKKYVDELCSEYTQKIVNYGKSHKKIYKDVNKIVIDKTKNILQNKNALESYSTLIQIQGPITEILANIKLEAERSCEVYVDDLIKRRIKSLKKKYSLNEINALYIGNKYNKHSKKLPIIAMRVQIIESRIGRFKNEIVQLLEKIEDINSVQGQTIINVIKSIRKDININYNGVVDIDTPYSTMVDVINDKIQYELEIIDEYCDELQGLTQLFTTIKYEYQKLYIVNRLCESIINHIFSKSKVIVQPAGLNVQDVINNDLKNIGDCNIPVY